MFFFLKNNILDNVPLIADLSICEYRDFYLSRFYK